MGLNLFPVRVPIGRTEINGQVADVLMTPEFARALSNLLERVGGETGMGNNDLAVLESFDQVDMITDLAQQVAQLRLQIEMLTQPDNSAAISFGHDLEIDYSFVQPITDWEHPGKIGAQTPNTGSFTLVKIAAGSVLLPSLYFSSDTTTGLYRPAANTLALAVSAVNVVTWSATGALYKQNVTTEKQFISSIAIGTAPLVVTSTTKVVNLNADQLDGADWAAPNAIGTTTPTTGAFTTLGASGGVTVGTPGALVSSSVAMSDGAAAGAGTLLNAPAAGNPTKWIPINDNGTTRYIPSW